MTFFAIECKIIVCGKKYNPQLCRTKRDKRVVYLVFSSLEFIFIFLPAFFIAYAAVPQKYRNFILFTASVIFYGLGVKKPVYIILFLLTLLLNFIVGQFIENARKTKKLWLFFGVAFNFWWLIFFKYWGFLGENINAVFKTGLTVKDIILPIGISFYTFQNVSYIADVYRGTVRAEKNLINYGAYLTMFPQLIAGPIVTYQTVAQQLRTRTHNIRLVEDGLKTFTIGLGYKVLIANQLSGLWNDIAMIGYESVSTPLAWMGIFAYSFQLYFDFNGYSLMAIGLGRIMGFEIPKNFDYPYLSVTMTEFWRRWHITLGTWFKENVYFPLGGSRRGPSKTLRNTFIVWLFTGVWHGASWNFIVWGLVLFAIIMSEKFWTGKFLNKYKFIGHCYMILIIPLTWLLFAITDFERLGVYFGRLIPIFGKGGTAVLENDYVTSWETYRIFFVAAFIFSTKLPEIIYKKIKNSPFCALILLAVFWGSVYCMYKGMNDPFMYFRF